MLYHPVANAAGQQSEEGDSISRDEINIDKDISTFSVVEWKSSACCRIGDGYAAAPARPVFRAVNTLNQEKLIDSVYRE